MMSDMPPMVGGPQAMPPQGFDPMGGPGGPNMPPGPGGPFEDMFDDPQFGGGQNFYNM